MRRRGNNQGQGRAGHAARCAPRPAPLAWALAAAALLSSTAVAQQRPDPSRDPSAAAQPPGLNAEEREEVARMMQELAALKAAYSQEVRRLRELDMQMQALQARISGRVPAVPQPQPQQAASAQSAQPPPQTATAQAPAQPPEKEPIF